MNLQDKQQEQETDVIEPSDFLLLNPDESYDSFMDQKVRVKPQEKETTSQIISHKVSLELVSSASPSVPSKAKGHSKMRKRKLEPAVRYVFVSRSESDVLEDGYKWRKYGKKSTKNNSNPRNYYKCSNSSCSVKKRVERDAQDKDLLITTYVGKHNHESPSVIYYIEKPTIFCTQQVPLLDQYPTVFYTAPS